jgi:hypothetical protein
MTGAGTLMMAPAHAAFELPEGERITHLPLVPRSIPQKEEYELYDPKIGKNFDLKNFWIRADLRAQSGKLCRIKALLDLQVLVE